MSGADQNILMSWPNRSSDVGEVSAIKSVLFDGDYAVSNEARLNRWKHKWTWYMSERPVNLYTVAFCRTCNKPHWFNAKHKHLTARCEGH